MSWDDAVWLTEPVDVGALLVPSRWRRYDHEDFTCWEFNGERWLIHRSRAAWAFLNRVITALATGSHGLGFDVFTDEPIR